MIDLLPSWSHGFLFYSMMMLDFLLVFSLVFSALYSLFLCVCFCFPRAVLACRHARITLFLYCAALLLTFTKAGDMTAGTASGVIRFFVGESLSELLLPDIPLLFWGAGSLLSLLFLARELAGLRRLAKASETVTNNQAFNKACVEMGMLGTALLRTPDSNRSAASWGLFVGRVFVPQDFASTYSDDEQYYIFLHELAHIRRLDTMKYLYAGLVRTLFWFHPLVLLSIRNIRDAIEVACDRETVLRHDVHRIRYAQLVVKSHANVSDSVPGFSHGAINIKQRLGHITNDPKWVKMQLRSLLLPALMLAITLFIVLSGRYVPFEPPTTPVIIDSPNGRKIRITTHFSWRGALGVHSMADAASGNDL